MSWDKAIKWKWILILSRKKLSNLSKNRKITTTGVSSESEIKLK